MIQNLFKNMKKINAFLLVVMLFLSSSSVFAQDKTAGAILDKMSSKYKAMKSFNATFSYRVKNSSGKLGPVKNGSVVATGVKFKLLMAGQEIYNNGSQISTYVKELNELNITEYDSSDDSDFSPTKIYTIYKNGYKYSLKGSKNVNGVATNTIELIPLKKGNISKINIDVAKSDNSIQAWEMVDSKGNTTIFKIKSFKSNVPVNNNLFNFNTASHPEVEIIDLR